MNEETLWRIATGFAWVVIFLMMITFGVALITLLGKGVGLW